MKNIFNQFKSLSLKFYILNLLQGIERISIWILIILLPIYIAQSDASGGLHWSHTEKGLLFAVWALSQNLTSIFSGYFADKYGRKLVISLASLFCGIFITFLAYAHSFPLFLIAITFTGISSGFFKPALQGAIANELNKENSSFAWSTYTWSINFFIFVFGTPLALYLSKISFQTAFIGAALVQILIPILAFLLIKKESKIITFQLSLNEIFETFKDKRLVYFALALSGFAITYMQFYENLPNYIFDWIYTQDLVKLLHLSDTYTTTTSIGKVVSYPWLFNLNTGLILLFCIPFAFLIKSTDSLKILLYSITIAVIGLLICGMSTTGLCLVIGIIIYTLGEMVTNPQINKYISSFAPKERHSQYMGAISIAWSVGLGCGAILGGYLYDNLSDKSHLAKYIKYPYDGMPINTTITNLLYNAFHPEIIWFVIAAIGLASIYFLYLYKKKFSSS